MISDVPRSNTVRWKMRVYASNILTEAEASGMIESVPVHLL